MSSRTVNRKPSRNRRRPGMAIHDFVIKGATGATRDGADLQETLKNFFENDIESGSYDRDHELRFEEYDDNGAKAIAVFADDTEIGSITGDDVAEVSALDARASSSKVLFGVNGHDIEEYESIIDRYKDKKFWKEEDPDFDDKAVNKAYNDLMEGLKEGKVYQASLKFEVEEEKEGISDEALETMTAEEKQRQANMDRFVKYFKLMFPLSIALVVIGVVYLKISLIMGVLNIFFGALGIYFSRRYTKQARKQEERKKREGQ